MVGKIFGSGESLKRVSHLIIIWFVIGFAFGVLYYYLPGDLINRGGQPVEGFFETIYFSFVTLLTIGYGDIVPITVLERLISIVI